MKYIITRKNTDYIPNSIINLQNNSEIEILNVDEALNQQLSIKETDKFYISSDTIYPLIRGNFKDDNIKNIIDIFRNKYDFRINLHQNFSDFFFDKVDFIALEKYHFDFRRKDKYVIKPCNGFMGAGARVVAKNSDLLFLLQGVKDEVNKYSQIYPNLFSADFIIEDYIAGDEYAVDMYYDGGGQPVIINIYKHPLAKRPEYLQMLYYTCQEVFELYHEYFLDFFSNINEKLKIKNFPIHAEFKQEGQGKRLIPIEFNSCRFGGMGLTDLTAHAFGFNPIKYYFDDLKPDWNKIWQERSGKYFCWVLGYNAADVDIKTHLPDHDKFKKSFPKTTKMLAYEKLDYLNLPAFALVYIETKNKDDLNFILNLEFNEYFKQESS